MKERIDSVTGDIERTSLRFVTGLLRSRLDRVRWQSLALGLILLGLAYGLLSAYLPPAVDWHYYFYPAARSWREPWDVPARLHNPPWLAFLLAPFGLLPEAQARAAFVLLSLVMLMDAARTIGAGRAGTIAALLAPPVLSNIANGQIDVLPLWGSTLGLRALRHNNPWLLSLGLLLVSTKPQVAGPVGVLLWLQSKHRTRSLVLPVAATVLSFIVYGWWIPRWQPVSLDVGWNVSVWPWGIPVGVILVSVAYVHRSHILAYLSTPFLSPYLAVYSLVGMSTASLSAIPDWLALPLLVFSWWLFIAFRRYR